MDEWEIFTEATLDAVHVEAEKKTVQFDLTCQWGVKTRNKIIVKGVDDFLINEMRLSNIVDRVILYLGSELNAPSRLFRLIRGRDAGVDELEFPLLKEKLSLMRNGKLVLLEIEPVYGAAVLILGENIQFSSIEEV